MPHHADALMCTTRSQCICQSSAQHVPAGRAWWPSAPTSWASWGSAASYERRVWGTPEAYGTTISGSTRWGAVLGAAGWTAALAGHGIICSSKSSSATAAAGSVQAFRALEWIVRFGQQLNSSIRCCTRTAARGLACRNRNVADMVLRPLQLCALLPGGFPAAGGVPPGPGGFPRGPASGGAPGGPPAPMGGMPGGLPPGAPGSGPYSGGAPAAAEAAVVGLWCPLQSQQ
jgi:hypothetical protein